MFRRIHQHIKSVQDLCFSRFSQKKPNHCKALKMLNEKSQRQSSSGQVAIILILVIAIALIFYAVSLNLARMNQAKTITTMSSNVGAALLASQMASYGQSIFKQTMGGRIEYCKAGSVWGAILGIFLVIIGIILAIPTGGASLVLSVIGFALAVAALVIQIVYIQPKLTELWNKMTQETLGIKDQFVEQGVRVGMQAAVTDTVQVPDIHDRDQDLLWGYEGLLPKDTISRFAFYYHERLLEIPKFAMDDLLEFLEKLREFLYACDDDEGDPWGLYDVTTCPGTSRCCYDGTNIVPSECNLCCVPKDAIDPVTGGLINLVPACCDCAEDTAGECWDHPEEECGVTTTCGLISPYGGDTPLVFDPFYQDPEEACESFLEKLGRDDEHKEYFKNYFDSNHYYEQQFMEAAAPKFRIKDATGYYRLPHYDILGAGGIPDERGGVFPFFYKIADWGFDLTALDLSTQPEHCYWYDYEFEPLCDPITSSPPDWTDVNHFPQELYNSLLDLDHDPTLSNLGYNTNPYVDSMNDNEPGFPALAPDRVVVKDGILAADNDCAMNALYDTSEETGENWGDVYDQERGFWKRGGDQYCSVVPPPPPAFEGEAWPYSSNCPKHLPGTCFEPGLDGGPNLPRECYCNEGLDPLPNPPVNPTQWPDDVLDQFVYSMPEFFPVAIKWLTAEPRDIWLNFEDWYDEMSYWIEPYANEQPGLACYNNCDFEDERSDPGVLTIWWQELWNMWNTLSTWRYTESFAGDDPGVCEQVWCVPPGIVGDEDAGDPIPGTGEVTCPGSMYFPPEEIDTFWAGEGGHHDIFGDISDIVACLNYNVEGFDFVAGEVKPPGTNLGNDVRFQNCRDTCSAADCDNIPGLNNLPRSLFPSDDYDPDDFEPADPVDEVDIALLLACFDDCNQANCEIMLEDRTSGGTYTWTDPPSTFDEAGGDCVPWAPGNIWYDEIIANLIFANPDCDLNFPDGWLERTGQSAFEAKNQVAKFKVRRDFLQARVDELGGAFPPSGLIGTIKEAEQRFKEFVRDIDSPGQKLIDARINYGAEGPGLTNSAVYAWKSQPTDLGVEGKWHAVRVDALIPERCEPFDCTHPDNEEQRKWPRVKTWTKDWGTTRCYRLINTDGDVKFKTTRFVGHKHDNPILFPNGVPLWDFRFFHPERPVPPGDIDTVCGALYAADPSIIPAGAPTGIYENAFMLSKRIPDGVPGSNRFCWDLIHQMLSGGATTTTCAAYYYHEGMRSGFGIKFIPCDPNEPL